MAYPTQLRRSAEPWLSQVSEERVIQTRTNLVDTGDGDKSIVVSPPFPSVMVPEGKLFQAPLPCSSMASPSPTQYCTWKARANGLAHWMRIPLIGSSLSSAITTHCGWSESSSPVKSWLRYGLLF